MQWCLLAEITERKKVQQVLQKSEAKCSSMVNDVINSSEVGIFVLDSNFKVVWINRKMEVFFGLRERGIQETFMSPP